MFKKSLLLISFLFASSMTFARSYVVYDFTNDTVLESDSPNSVLPIASVTKLMTANVFLENNTNPNCTASITDEDYDYIKNTGSKLPKYTPIACSELLKAMFVHSDNYAAHALSRSAGMTRIEFIGKMNQKARELGMSSTRFIDSSGLSSLNVSSAMDLVKLAKYSLNKPELNQMSNARYTYVQTDQRSIFMQNTNKLVREEMFDAAISKTGYIRESGYNLVFINRHNCNNAMIGVISLNNASSAQRANFTQSKLERYGCYGATGGSSSGVIVAKNYKEHQQSHNYDEEGMDRLMRQLSQ